MIKKLVTGALAALTVGGVAVAGPASAQTVHGAWHGGYSHGSYSQGWRGDHHRGSDAGAVIGAGILGLALGAALSSSHPAPHYVAPAYYGCGSHWRWDGYAGRYVLVSNCY
jgi:hypothetical protein